MGVVLGSRASRVFVGFRTVLQGPRIDFRRFRRF